MITEAARLLHQKLRSPGASLFADDLRERHRLRRPSP